MREITSATNPFIKQLRALIDTKKARRQSQSFVIEGWRGIDTLLRHPSRNYQLETLVITPEWIDDPRLPEEIDTVLLPDSLLNKVSDVQNTQGILGIIKHKPEPFSVPEEGNLLLVDNLRDPGNLGTLIRSAVGAGFDGVLLYGDCVDPYSPKVIRSTMGTFAYSNLWSITDQEIEHLQAAGFELCITTGLGGTNLYETRFNPKTILAIGSEAHGISDTLQQCAVKKITIPLQPECESLNAAVAGSICMFHIART
ncbi:MAG: RNA methyltransferase [Pontiellaceae bacterium]|nr:RNA methyltransferase [Pontiellaceae bacterium]